MVRAEPQTLFCFGDNMQRRGMGGQAAAMRGAANAIGVPTKWAPAHHPDAYFTDDDWRDADVRQAIAGAFDQIEAALVAGRDVVIPAAGLGTGLAELPRRAPRIFAYIEGRIAALTRPEGAEP
jgi:hypothetical protein